MAKDQEDYRNMVDELLEVDDGLSDWEFGFIDNVDKWSGDYTVAQQICIEEVWNKTVGMQT